MAQEDIIRMYEEANGWSPEGFDRTVQELERFAELVRADERDRAMRENAYVAEEREAILELVDSYKNNTDLADDIRARGQA